MSLAARQLSSGRPDADSPTHLAWSLQLFTSSHGEPIRSGQAYFVRAGKETEFYELLSAVAAAKTNVEAAIKKFSDEQLAIINMHKQRCSNIVKVKLEPGVVVKSEPGVVVKTEPGLEEAAGP